MFFCLETRGSRWYCAWGTALFSAPEEGRETEACDRSFSTATAGRALLADNIGDENDCSRAVLQCRPFLPADGLISRPALRGRSPRPQNATAVHVTHEQRQAENRLRLLWRRRPRGQMDPLSLP